MQIDMGKNQIMVRHAVYLTKLRKKQLAIIIRLYKNNQDKHVKLQSTVLYQIDFNNVVFLKIWLLLSLMSSTEQSKLYG